MANRTTKQKRNNLITGNTGMYFVAYQLSRRGWNVMPTSRNARAALTFWLTTRAPANS
jgi:hypothetical protein